MRGEANHVLTRSTARDMLSPYWKNGVINILGTSQDPDQMGLGWFVGVRKGRFGHTGGNVGYQATLVMFADTGSGSHVGPQVNRRRASGACHHARPGGSSRGFALSITGWQNARRIRQ